MAKVYSFCIVGGGPSGFYTAKKLLQSSENILVHVFERLPFPFGLLRYGVAPDHQDVKKIASDYNQLSRRYKNFRFFGNVEMGRTLQIPDVL